MHVYASIISSRRGIGYELRYQRNSKYPDMVTSYADGISQVTPCIASDPDDKKKENSMVTMSSCRRLQDQISLVSLSSTVNSSGAHKPQYDVVTQRHRFEQLLTDGAICSD